MARTTTTKVAASTRKAKTKPVAAPAAVPAPKAQAGTTSATPKAASAKPGPRAAKATASRVQKAAAVVGRAPLVTKDNLRAQIEKLEQSNAKLQEKAREARKTAKATAIRITELEAEVARLTK